MRLFSKPPQRHVSQPAGFTSLFFAGDFVRMIIAAVAVGVVFSAGAATLTLLLSGPTNATVGQDPANATQSIPAHKRAVFQHNAQNIKPALAAPSAEPGEMLDRFLPATQPAPSNLFVLDGCGGRLIYASERDIQITISCDRAEVQVMQTFVVESNDRHTPQTALFQASLPSGADFQSLRIQTDRTTLLGQFSNGAAGIDTPDDDAEARRLNSQGLVRYFQSSQPSAENTITTDLLTGLMSGESLVVVYRYQIPVKSVAGIAAISLALANTPDLNPIADGIGQRQQQTDTATSIWVIWTDAPKKMVRPPLGLIIERSGNGAGRIEAASWQSATLPPNGKFQLAWIP